MVSPGTVWQCNSMCTLEQHDDRPGRWYVAWSTPRPNLISSRATFIALGATDDGWTNVYLMNTGRVVYVNNAFVLVRIQC